jgi:CBS domain-containing protein
MPVGTLAVDAVTASKDTAVEELAGTMKNEGVGDVVIVEDEKPVGIVTDRDIALAVGDGSDVSSLTASDLMTEDPLTIEADAEAVELPKTMADGNVRRVPVVDGGGKLQGIATLDDVVSTVGEEMEDISTVIEAQSPGYSVD